MVFQYASIFRASWDTLAHGGKLKHAQILPYEDLEKLAMKDEYDYVMSDYGCYVADKNNNIIAIY